MSQSAKANRPGRSPKGPDISLVPEAAAPPADGTPAPRAPDGAAVPAVTLNDPWRYLHPSRVWPD